MLRKAKIEFTDTFSPEAKSLIKALTSRDPNLRACCTERGGFLRFRKQPFFKNVDWDLLSVSL